MREIKFRAWDKENNRFLFFTLEGLSYQSDLGSINIEKWEDIVQVEDLIFQEYTGLKSKSGVEIYEGDIVIHRYPEEDREMMGDDWETVCVIEYSEKLGMWLIDDKSGNTPDCFESHAENEVIGNIYENPELLKEKENE